MSSARRDVVAVGDLRLQIERSGKAAWGEVEVDIGA
jgi:hypothetical protein